MPIFGRRTSPPPPRQPPPSPPAEQRVDAPLGHRNVLDHLRKVEGTEPLARPQLVGKLLFDLFTQMIATDRGVRIEDLIAVLASTGGFSCLMAALSSAHDDDRSLPNSLVIMTGKDGHQYFFGDLPNRYLVESHLSLLSLALGAAQSCGGQVSLAMVHDAMAHVAGTVGGESFGQPRLPAANQLSDLPFNYVRHMWPKVLEALRLYEVQPTQWPAAIGFALQRAIDAGKTAIDPTLAARIAIECAVPMAKLEPRRISRG